jgi:hypothetical protein
MWDSFAAGVAISSMRHGKTDGGNDFAESSLMSIPIIVQSDVAEQAISMNNELVMLPP